MIHIYKKSNKEQQSMTVQNLQERVKDVVARVLEVDPSTVREDSNFVFDLGASSMQSLLLVGAFEEEFGIKMAEDKALEVQTVADACEFISGHLADAQKR
jgi:acyl carrier protein